MREENRAIIRRLFERLDEGIPTPGPSCVLPVPHSAVQAARNRFHQLLTRWEKKVENYWALLHFARRWITSRAAEVVG